MDEILAGIGRPVISQGDGERREVVGKNHREKTLAEDVSRGFSMGQRSIFLKYSPDFSKKN
jgi:hypothetical protein